MLTMFSKFLQRVIQIGLRNSGPTICDRANDYFASGIGLQRFRWFGTATMFSSESSAVLPLFTRGKMSVHRTGLNHANLSGVPGKIPVVEYDYVKSLVNNKNGTLVDVREPDELKNFGQIPTAKNIRLADLPTALSNSPKDLGRLFGLDNVKSYEDEIVFLCQRGRRGEQACEIARKLGYRNVKNYLGSYQEWSEKETKK